METLHLSRSEGAATAPLPAFFSSSFFFFFLSVRARAFYTVSADRTWDSSLTFCDLW